jgi:dGTPase
MSTAQLSWSSLVRLRDDGRGTTSGRSEYERDQDRILFSSPFRRLNDKTQVLPIPETYFVHNRLTHSIETASVGRSLGNIVGQRVLSSLDPDWKSDESRDLGALVQAACLAHDIGNPPFGHSGEDAISAFFLRRPEVLSGLDEAERRDFTAFEGNAQGLRIISSREVGLCLTANTLATFTKYPRESVVRGGYAEPESAKRRDQKKYGAFQSERTVLEAILSACGMPRLSEGGLAFARHPFAFLVEAADDVCYLIIDLEDAVRLGIIGLSEVEDDLEAIVAANPDRRSKGGLDPSAQIEASASRHQGSGERIAQYRAKAINSLIFQCAEVFASRAAQIAAGTYAGSLTQEIPSAAALERIGEVSREKLYRYRPVLEIEAAGFEVLDGVLEMLVDCVLEKLEDPGRFSRDRRAAARLELFPELEPREGLSRYEALRRVTDYVSGMTDSFALSTYRRLKGMELPKMY